MQVSDFGVYLHIPFCTRRCDYCAFATWDDRPHLLNRYVAALAAELERAIDELPPLTSVFIGGGTPSLLRAEQLEALLTRLPINHGTEITIEVNPESVTPVLLDGYRAAGVTRVSLGIQSFVDGVLLALDRRHDAAQAIAAARAVAAAGFDSWNVDLIYGARGEQTHDWRHSVSLAIELGAPHVSAYALTVEAGTPLAEQPTRWPDEDDQADKYLLADTLLASSGRRWYEISNWSLEGHQCRHNLLYWNQGDYAGFGCAAHSHRNGRRSWNIRPLERYLAAIEAGHSPEAGSEQLDASQQRLEAAQLLLRTAQGVPRAWLPPHIMDDGLVFPSGPQHQRWVLTRRGRLLANEVALLLDPDPPHTARSGNRT